MDTKKKSGKLTIGVLIFIIIYIVFLIYRAFFVYVPGVYVCYNMAGDLEKELEKAGIDTKICRGDSNFRDEGHAWIAINIFGFLLHIDSIGWYPFIPELLFHNIEIYEDYPSYLESKIIQ